MIKVTDLNLLFSFEANFLIDGTKSKTSCTQGGGQGSTAKEESSPQEEGDKETGYDQAIPLGFPREHREVFQFHLCVRF